MEGNTDGVWRCEVDLESPREWMPPLLPLTLFDPLRFIDSFAALPGAGPLAAAVDAELADSPSASILVLREPAGFLEIAAECESRWPEAAGEAIACIEATRHARVARRREQRERGDPTGSVRPSVDLLGEADRLVSSDDPIIRDVARLYVLGFLQDGLTETYAPDDAADLALQLLREAPPANAADEAVLLLAGLPESDLGLTAGDLARLDAHLDRATTYQVPFLYIAQALEAGDWQRASAGRERALSIVKAQCPGPGVLGSSSEEARYCDLQTRGLDSLGARLAALGVLSPENPCQAAAAEVWRCWLEGHTAASEIVSAAFEVGNGRLGFTSWSGGTDELGSCVRERLVGISADGSGTVDLVVRGGDVPGSD